MRWGEMNLIPPPSIGPPTARVLLLLLYTKTSFHVWRTLLPWEIHGSEISITIYQTTRRLVQEDKKLLLVRIFLHLSRSVAKKIWNTGRKRLVWVQPAKMTIFLFCRDRPLGFLKKHGMP
jgi:hypothetical protein